MRGESAAILNIKSVPSRILQVEYAVRGLIVTKANEIDEAIKKDPKLFPFPRTIPMNIGNPQILGQKPLTFFRQLIASLSLPSIASQMPKDVQERCLKSYQLGVNIGAYTDSRGHPYFRQLVAAWLQRRDGGPSPPLNSIFLTDGASSGVRLTLEFLIGTSSDGVMVPVPQYPLYTASLTRLGGQAAFYFLNESHQWSVDEEELIRGHKEATERGVNVRGIVVINPGNPAGSVLSRVKIQTLLSFCRSKKMVILADEVYQENVYHSDQFVSVRRVALEEGFSDIPIFSYHSCSKGFIGECGLRGGMMQIDNIPSDVLDQLTKIASVGLCANTIGQAVMANVVNPPLQSDPSFPLYIQERNEIFDAYKRKSKFITERLNQMEGVHCQEVQGALYAFPSIKFSDEAIETARSEGYAVDMMYCIRLLESTGITLVPGSGFAQAAGSFHVRLTILPQEEDLREIMDKMAEFHEKFLLRFPL